MSEIDVVLAGAAGETGADAAGGAAAGEKGAEVAGGGEVLVETPAETPAETGADAAPEAAPAGPDMAVDLGGIRMQNPICTASGTFGFGWQFEGFEDVGRLGAITCKGVAAESWPGNPAPRMCEVPAGIMNTVGLANPGVAAFVAQNGEYLADLERRGCRVIVQVVGHSVEECVAAAELAEELCPWASGLELNVSCPNLARGGALLGGTPEAAEEVVGAVRRVVKRPLLVKMAPKDVAEVARACEAAGADALSLINTISGMAIDVRTRKSKLSRPTGGVSGPAIHAIAVRMVWEAANAVHVPINGMGGVATAEDAAEMILAGATAVSVGTANFSDPDCAVRIADGLAEWVASQGVSSVTELRGAVIC